MLPPSVGNDVRLDEDGGRSFLLNVCTIYETTRLHIPEYTNFMVNAVRIANLSFPLVSFFTYLALDVTFCEVAMLIVFRLLMCCFVLFILSTSLPNCALRTFDVWNIVIKWLETMYVRVYTYMCDG